MLKEYRADLHIHTILSPCTELTEMSPHAIVQRALQIGLDSIAVCDHNSCENVAALQSAARNTDLVAIAGIEVTSQEEVHVLGLFDREEEVGKLQEVVYAHLPGENDEETFGHQVVVNEEEEVVCFNKKLLIGATTLTLEKIVDLIHSLKGLAVASHVDREAFSVIGQLGFIPPEVALDALEFSPRVTREEVKKKFPQTGSYPLITSSDAHYLDDIGKSSTTFWMETVTVKEMKLAFEARDGRKVIWEEK
jgi:PHP family Zn ribbon phosphoesterase